MFARINSHARHSPVVRPATEPEISSRRLRSGNGSPRSKRHEKTARKNCDIIVANDARIGMESDENELLILFRDGEMKKVSRASKKILARELVKIF